MLEIRHLNKNFGKKQVLNDLSFQFNPGVYGLLGPNGAGKTTLIRCLTNIYPVKKGTIFFEGKDITAGKTYLAEVGYLPQKFGMFKELTVREMLQSMANLKGIDKKEALPMIEEALELVNLSDRLNSRVGSLSGGMVRRLGIAQAILNDPKVILFDEPTTGLDPEERLRFKSVINKLRGERVILISTHIVEDVEALCDVIAVMKADRISVSGTCQEIQQLAQGKVYELEEGKLSEIVGQYHMQKNYERDGKRLVKILSKDPQPFQAVPPSVEDGYICVLKGI